MVQISVVMSVYNAEAYIREAIESVLKQTYKDFEFIIINDGSTDKSREIVQSYSDERIVVLEQENRGLSMALNRGIKCSRGKYISRMDADDIAYPKRLEIQYEFLEANKDYIAVGSEADVISLEGDYLYTSRQPLSWTEIQVMLPSTPFFHSSVMFRRKEVLDLGGYDEIIKQEIEDVLLWNKLAKSGKLANIGHPLIQYRLVPSAISNRSVKSSFEFKEIVEEYIANSFLTESSLQKLKALSEPKSTSWKYSNYFLRVGKIFIEQRFDRIKALDNIVKSIFYSPTNFNAYFNFFLLLLPHTWIVIWKRSRMRR